MARDIDLNPARNLRLLLRKLRDLNLAVRRVAIDSDAWVRLSGCLSIDRPVEKGVAYRLSNANGSEWTLALEPRDDTLVVRLDDGRSARELDVPFEMASDGKLLSSALSARIDAETIDRRDLEHFMRRVVRTVCAGRAA